MRVSQLAAAAAVGALALVTVQATPQDDFAAAVLADNAAGISSALGASANVNTPITVPDSGGVTVHALFLIQSVASANALLAAPAVDVNPFNSDVGTPLLFHVRDGRRPVVQALLGAAGIGKAAVDGQGFNALGLVSKIQGLPQEGFTPVPQATVTGIMDDLIDAMGFALDHINNEGQTPLMSVITTVTQSATYKAALVTSLVSVGADATLEDDLNATALELACDPANGNGATVTALLGAAGVTAGALNDAGDSCVHILARSARGFNSETTLALAPAAVSIVQALNAASADMDQINSAGDSALHIAAADALTEVVQALVTAGVRDNILDASNNTALHRLSDIISSDTDDCARRVATATVLVNSAGSDRALINNNNQTALQEAESALGTRCSALEILLGSTTATLPPTGNGAAHATAASALAAIAAAALALML